jgi:UDP-glucose 4-epimerase
LQNKHIVVTGGAGFLGSHLFSITEKGTVTILDDFSYGKNCIQKLPTILILKLSKLI